jgi:hypothetical protein
MILLHNKTLLYLGSNLVGHKFKAVLGYFTGQL